MPDHAGNGRGRHEPQQRRILDHRGTRRTPRQSLGRARRSGDRRRGEPMRRDRAQGRYESSPTFAFLPSEILTSDALKACPDYAFRCLVCLASFNTTNRDPARRKGNPGNNGTLSLRTEQAQQFGISPWRVTAGMKILEQAGLIEVTRQGRIENGQGICSLYGLTWLPIAPSDKYDQPRTIPRNASNGWLRFKKPDDWNVMEKTLRQRAQGSRPHQTSWAGRSGNSPHKTSGAGKPPPHKTSGTEPHKTSGTERPSSHTRRLVTFMNSGRGSRGSAPLSQQLADVRLADCIAVARAHPNLDAPALAERCKTDEATAHRALQAIQAGAAA